MKLQRIALLSAVGFLAAACSSDTGPHVTGACTSCAYVRYVNAVPDTNGTDFKFVDQVDGSPYPGQLQFRDMTGYMGVQSGSRHIRIFSIDPNGQQTSDKNENNINVVSATFVDTNLTFQAGVYYTVLHSGYSRTGSTPKQGLTVIVDNPTTPSSSQIGVRAVNADPTTTSADIYAAATATGTPAFAGLKYNAASAYTAMGMGALTFSETAAGQTTVLSSAAAPAGAGPASISQSALGGYSIGGSLLSAFVFPPAVAGSLALQSTNINCIKGVCATQAIIWIQDNFPDQPKSAGT